MEDRFVEVICAMQAAKKDKFTLAVDYMFITDFFIEIERPDYLKRCDEQWLEIFYHSRTDIRNYLRRLIEKGYSKRLLELFEDLDFKSHFYDYFEVIQKLYVNDKYRLGFKSQKLYNDIQVDFKY